MNSIEFATSISSTDRSRLLMSLHLTDDEMKALSLNSDSDPSKQYTNSYEQMLHCEMVPKLTTPINYRDPFFATCTLQRHQFDANFYIQNDHLLSGKPLNFSEEKPNNGTLSCKIEYECLTISDDLLLETVVERSIRIVSKLRYSHWASEQKTYYRLACEPLGDLCDNMIPLHRGVYWNLWASNGHKSTLLHLFYVSGVLYIRCYENVFDYQLFERLANNIFRYYNSQKVLNSAISDVWWRENTKFENITLRNYLLNPAPMPSCMHPVFRKFWSLVLRQNIASIYNITGISIQRTSTRIQFYSKKCKLDPESNYTLMKIDVDRNLYSIALKYLEPNDIYDTDSGCSCTVTGEEILDVGLDNIPIEYMDYTEDSRRIDIPSPMSEHNYAANSPLEADLIDCINKESLLLMSSAFSSNNDTKQDINGTSAEMYIRNFSSAANSPTIDLDLSCNDDIFCTYGNELDSLLEEILRERDNVKDGHEYRPFSHKNCSELSTKANVSNDFIPNFDNLTIDCDMFPSTKDLFCHEVMSDLFSP